MTGRCEGRVYQREARYQREGGVTDGSQTHRDILAQAQTLPETLEVLRGEPLPAAPLARKRRFVFTGCGSSYYAGRCAASLLRVLAGVDARAVPASELWLLPEENLSHESLVVGISRTGTTTEVVRALDAARRRRATTLAISIGPRPETFEFADLRIWLRHATEESPVMTQSFSNLLLAAQHVAVEIACELGASQAQTYRRGLKEAVSAVAMTLGDLDREARSLAAGRPDHVVFLGSGPHEGLCAEAALKVKEMARLPVESHSLLEFRHGPIATLTPGSLVVVLSNQESLPFSEIVLADADLIGSRAVEIAATSSPRAARRRAGMVCLPSAGPGWLAGNVALPFLQLLALNLTVGLGQTPESVRHLDRFKEPCVDPHVVDLDLDLRPLREG